MKREVVRYGVWCRWTNQRASGLEYLDRRDAEILCDLWEQRRAREESFLGRAVDALLGKRSPRYEVRASQSFEFDPFEET